MEKELRKLGFDDKEAAVYLAVLASGTINPSDISRHTSLKRATVYFYIDRLKEKGFLQVEIRGKRGVLIAVAPKQAFKKYLEREREKIEERGEIAKRLIEELGTASPNVSADTRSRVSYYEGEQGIRVVIDKILAAKQNVYWLGSIETLLSTVGGKRLYKLFTTKRLKQGTISHAMTDKDILKYPQFSEIIGNKRLYRFLDEKFSTPSILVLFGSSIALLSRDGSSIRVVLIEDTFMHDVIQFLFSSLWSRL